LGIPPRRLDPAVLLGRRELRHTTANRCHVALSCGLDS